MATIPIPTDPAEALALAQRVTAEHGAAVSTRSEPGVGLVYVVPDAPAPKKAPAKKPAAAGAAATD